MLCAQSDISILAKGVWVIKLSFFANLVLVAVCGVPFSGSEGALGGFLKFLAR